MKGKMLSAKIFTIVVILLFLMSEFPSTSYNTALSATVYSRTYTLNGDFDEGVLVGVEHESVPDQLQLSQEHVTLPFIWIPNENGTISKVNTETGNELGRYMVTPHSNSSPSRTTVDLQGSCWVGNRQAGTVVKVGLLEGGQCIDRNGNGTIETSQDLNYDGDITGGELLPWGEDECVLHEVVLIPGMEGPYVPGTFLGPYDDNYWGTAPRGLAIDASNNLWAGTYSPSKYYYIDGSTGSVLRTVDVSPWDHHAYGAVIDRNGVLWSSGHGGGHVLRLDPSLDPPAISTLYMGHFVYGLGVDYLDHLFVSGWTDQRLSRVDINTATIDWSVLGPYSARGVAATSDNNIWVASTNLNKISRFDNDGNSLTDIYVYGGPTGVAVDAAGKVWVTTGGDLYRIDPTTNTVDLTKTIVDSWGHYGYSDMTGIIARTLTTRIGTWTVIFDSGEADTPWGEVSWNSEVPAGTSITVKVRSSNDQISWSSWEVVTNGAPFGSTSDGRYLQIETTLQILAGDNSPILYDLTVNVANQPPVADADGPYSVQEDMTISLDGTGSSDPDGDALTYDWDLDNDGIFETPGATPDFSKPDIGIYPVALQVCDPWGACDVDTTEVYVTIEPGLFPSELTAYMIAGESITELKTVNVPPRPPNADVVFSFDLTGSMGGIIDTAKANANQVVDELNALSGVSIQYGLMSYMDYPNVYNSCGYYASYGNPGCGDYAYNLGLSITDDASAVTTAINALSLGCGDDGPQDYTRIFYESYADPNVDWRAGAKRILLNFGDDIPHDCNLKEGLYGGVWSTGCDPGRDATAGTGDDLDLQTVLAEMNSNGVVLLEAHTTTYANVYWQHWTGLTGGQVFITGSSTMVDDIVAAITEALEAPIVYGLHLEAESPYESWLSTDPAYLDVDPGMIGVSVDFDATFTVPPGTEPGEYNFTVYAMDENGVIYGEQEVTIIVLPPSMVTDSGLCTFDRAPDIEGQQFRLIFTPDMRSWPAYKLPASNPGQFYYNVFYAGDGPVDLDITIPYPFETQGANPVHVYGGRSVLAYDDTICFVPDYSSEIYAGDLENLPDELPGGFIYVAIHLDYGLKGTTGYIPNENKDALDAADGVTVLIPNLDDYTFSVSGSQADSQTIQNINEFKKIPGVGGLVMEGVNPVAGATVDIYINGALRGTAITDEDGWYMLAYKHTGKSVPYTVRWRGSGLGKSGTLKANQFVEVNFP